MDLESRVKAYAEEARRILLQRVLEAKGQKGSKAFWQGYTTNGNGVVKLPDGKYKTVKVIGNIVLPKESIVYIDEQNTVEVGFRKELPATRSQGKQQLKPTIADRIKRPLLLASDEEEVFGWIVIYHSDSSVFNANNISQTWAKCDSAPYAYNYQIYDYDSDTHANQHPATHGKCLRVSAVYAYGATVSYGGTYFALDATADATATLGSLSASVSVNPPASTYERDYDFDYAIEETNLSQDAECEAETLLYNGNPHGRADAEAETAYFQFPNAKIYLQWPDAPNGDANRITLDLNNYVDYTVAKFDRARNYVKLEDGATILYHTYSVGHVDTSAEADPYSVTSFVPYVGNVTKTWIHFGKIYKGILHLRTNLSTGSTTSIYTPAEGYNNDDYLGYIYYNDDGILMIWDNRNLDYWDYYDHPQAIWQNAFDGDWISAFSGIAWDATAQVNVSASELDFFLEISWDPVSEIWSRGLNSSPPYSLTYAQVYNFDPVTSQTNQNEWLDGQPYYNNYYDIENLGSVVRWNSTSIEDLPGKDDFVEVDVNGLSNPYLPNYQYKISTAETNYHDRISAAYISYQPYPGEQENGG